MTTDELIRYLLGCVLFLVVVVGLALVGAWLFGDGGEAWQPELICCGVGE